ncbi:MAG TPA: hypothetical protein VJ852_15100, partial [Gemmatimonadaceae bacterium]|nr:hypothetical protein [Gemmatimonadaceae bacterium]
VALRIDGPANGLIGWPVNFDAFIMERNGDVGARASCVLYVDGIAADRSDGIWVDAGGIVECKMAHVFSNAGNHAVELRVENVQPGDYDDASNRVSSSIEIVQPEEFLAYSLGANSIVYNSWTRNISQLTTLEGIVETWDQTISTQGPQQSGLMIGVMPRKLAFPVTVHGEMETNGARVNTLDETLATSELAYWYPPDWTVYCGTSFHSNSDLYVCTFDTGPIAGYSTIQYDWSGAEVRYHSVSYVTYWDPTCANNLCERYIVNDFTDSRPMVTFGPDFTSRLAVQGAGDAVPTAATATVTFSPFSFDYDYTDPGCSTTPVSLSCTESHLHGVGVNGFIQVGSAP